MNKSESLKNIAAALMNFHTKVSRVRKDSTNPFFKSKYASLSNILEVISQPLVDAGLSFSQFPAGDNGLTTILMHQSGEFLESTYEMKPSKDDPQGRGSAITYQRRYALAAVLGLNIDEDDDGNKASGLNGYKKEAVQTPVFNYTLQMQEGLLSLLNNSTYDSASKEYASIKDSINDHTHMTEILYKRIKSGLDANQVLPQHRGNMSETEVKNTVKKIAKQPA